MAEPTLASLKAQLDIVIGVLNRRGLLSVGDLAAVACNEHPDPSPDDAAFEARVEDQPYALAPGELRTAKDAFLGGAAHGRKGERNKTLADVLDILEAWTFVKDGEFNGYYVKGVLRDLMDHAYALDEGAAKQ